MSEVEAKNSIDEQLVMARAIFERSINYMKHEFYEHAVLLMHDEDILETEIFYPYMYDVSAGKRDSRVGERDEGTLLGEIMGRIGVIIEERSSLTVISERFCFTVYDYCDFFKKIPAYEDLKSGDCVALQVEIITNSDLPKEYRDINLLRVGDYKEEKGMKADGKVDFLYEVMKNIYELETAGYRVRMIVIDENGETVEKDTEPGKCGMDVVDCVGVDNDHLVGFPCSLNSKCVNLSDVDRSKRSPGNGSALPLERERLLLESPLGGEVVDLEMIDHLSSQFGDKN